MHWNTGDGKFVFIEFTILWFWSEGCGTQLKQETILDSHSMSGATCFCCQKVCVCVFRKGCEIPCYFNLQFFHAFPVDGKVSMMFQGFSILFENSHFILPPTLNFSKWESLPQCHWQLVVIQLQVLAVRWACRIKYSQMCWSDQSVSVMLKCGSCWTTFFFPGGTADMYTAEW